MRIPTRVSLAAIGAVLVVGTLAVPAAAANPRLAVVQGIPGKTVDVCIGATEVRSRVRYGAWFQTTVGAGTRTIKFRTAERGRCTGKVLVTRTLDLQADDDVTLVATAKSPKVVVWDNLTSPAPVGNIDWIAVRNASDVSDVLISVLVGNIVNPSALPQTWDKGDEWRQNYGTSSLAFVVGASQMGVATPFVGPNQFIAYQGRRHELVLVGSKPRNARFVAVVRSTIAP
jgi:hypothetical protein